MADILSEKLIRCSMTLSYRVTWINRSTREPMYCNEISDRITPRGAKKSFPYVRNIISSLLSYTRFKKNWSNRNPSMPIISQFKNKLSRTNTGRDARVAHRSEFLVGFQLLWPKILLILKSRVIFNTFLFDLLSFGHRDFN